MLLANHRHTKHSKDHCTMLVTLHTSYRQSSSTGPIQLLIETQLMPFLVVAQLVLLLRFHWRILFFLFLCPLDCLCPFYLFLLAIEHLLQLLQVGPFCLCLLTFLSFLLYRLLLRHSLSRHSLLHPQRQKLHLLHIWRNDAF